MPSYSVWTLEVPSVFQLGMVSGFLNPNGSNLPFDMGPELHISYIVT